MNIVSPAPIPRSLLLSIFDFPDCTVAEEKWEASFEQIHITIKALPKLQGEIIRLRYYHQLMAKEIALKLHLSESYIRSRHNQAMHRLRMAGNARYREMMEG